MKILLAGPGTGKTTKIKSIIEGLSNDTRFLILSFTNNTINDLQISLKDHGITESNCMTLHKFAVKYNHDYSRQVLLTIEIDKLNTISKGTNIEFDKLCDFLCCTTFDQMIARFVEYAKVNPLYLKQKLSEFDYLIIDEYQDFNPLEQMLIDHLIAEMQESFVLGDDDQCIYDFKDASSAAIISFYNNPKNERIDHEHKCYRCPDKVVTHATRLIKHNKKRIDKQWDMSGNQGEIVYSQKRTLEEVANDIVSIIPRLNNESVLILSPVCFAIEPLVKKLEEHDIEFTNYFSNSIPKELITKSWVVKFLFGHFKYINLVLLGYSNLNNRKKFYELLKRHFDQGTSIDELFELLKTSCLKKLRTMASYWTNF